VSGGYRLLCIARHTGHADILREAVDGLVGEGPPKEFTV
jgi:hypothetical protein